MHAVSCNIGLRYNGTGLYLVLILDIGTWQNGCVNNRYVGDLRRHRAHYDVTVIVYTIHFYICYANVIIVLSSTLVQVTDWHLVAYCNSGRWNCKQGISTHPGPVDVVKWKPFPRYWPFARGIHWSPMNSPSKRQWRGTLKFSLMCAWIND